MPTAASQATRHPSISSNVLCVLFLLVHRTAQNVWTAAAATARAEAKAEMEAELEAELEADADCD